MTKEDIVVIIPAYKETPGAAELLALKQCVKVLADYKLVLVTPDNLNTGAYLEVYKEFDRVSFHPKYFNSIAGYNKLMMSHFFYKKFRQYAYMLVYQLDAFVFRDELLEWCQKGYDYIGAPWLVESPAIKENVIFNFSKRMVNHVGNGGFSLRKIETVHVICRLFLPFMWLFPKNEDLFWGYLLNKVYPYFKKPGVDEALSFAFESEPRKAFERNNRQLPFGCHAWEKYDPEFWDSYINVDNKI